MKLRTLFCAALCAVSLLAVGCGNSNSNDDEFVNAAAIQAAQAQQNVGGQLNNGGTFNLTFSGSSSASITPFTLSDSGDSAVVRANTATSISVLLTDSSINPPVVLLRTLDLNIKNQNGLAAGQDISFSSNNNDNPAVNAVYAEQGGVPQTWVANSGNLHIDSLSGNQVVVTLTNVNFTPQSGAASGDFMITTGTATINL